MCVILPLFCTLSRQGDALQISIIIIDKKTMLHLEGGGVGGGGGMELHRKQQQNNNTNDNSHFCLR